jgi:hypothetical protein
MSLTSTMPSILHKTDSGTDKQIIEPKKWTYVRFDKKLAVRVPVTGVYHWAVILRTEYPTTGAPNVIRGRFVRYPNTPKADETGHDDKNVYSFNGETLHSHWSHYFQVGKTMPVGFWIWHNGTKSITLDGRQIKATT